jgi:hypothetical protein
MAVGRGSQDTLEQMYSNPHGQRIATRRDKPHPSGLCDLALGLTNSDAEPARNHVVEENPPKMVSENFSKALNCPKKSSILMVSDGIWLVVYLPL